MGDVNWDLTANIPQFKLPDFAGDAISYRQAGLKERYAADDQARQEAQNQADIASQQAQDKNDADAAQRQAAGEKLKALQSFSTAVKQASDSGHVPAEQAFAALYPHFAPTLAMSPQDAQEFQATVAHDPSILDGLAARAGQAYEFLNTTSGVVRGNKSTGEANLAVPVTPKAPAPHYIKIAGPPDANGNPTEQIVEVGGGSGNAPASAPSAGSYAGSGATRGDRNNNPFNVKTPPQGPWQGQTGVDEYGHAVFDKPENGLRAGDLNLQAYAKHGITTPEAFVNRYAGEAAPQVKANYTAAIRSAVGDQFDLTNPQTPRCHHACDPAQRGHAHAFVGFLRPRASARARRPCRLFDSGAGWSSRSR